MVKGSSWWSMFLLVVLALAVWRCDSKGNLIGPQNQLEVTNVADSFQWQVSDLADVTQTLTYAWTNTGSGANVNQASSVAGGTATLVVTDAGGTEVYASSLSQNGTFQTATGEPGAWTVTVTLTDVDGTLNFRLQKP